MSCASDPCILFCSASPFVRVELLEHAHFVCTYSLATQFFKMAFLWWLLLRLRRSAKFPSYPWTLFYMIYSVYTNALCRNEDMPCSVKRPLSSTHTNKWLPADCVDFKERYVKSVTESTNTAWDVPVSTSHHQQPLRSLAYVPTAASNIYRIVPATPTTSWATTDPCFTEPSFFQSSRL